MPRPMATDVELKVGDTVYWDDRLGWEGKIILIRSNGLIDVQYTDPGMNGLIDTAMNPIMYTVRKGR